MGESVAGVGGGDRLTSGVLRGWEWEAEGEQAADGECDDEAGGEVDEEGESGTDPDGVGACDVREGVVEGGGGWRVHIVVFLDECFCVPVVFRVCFEFGQVVDAVICPVQIVFDAVEVDAVESFAVGVLEHFAVSVGDGGCSYGFADEGVSGDCSGLEDGEAAAEDDDGGEEEDAVREDGEGEYRVWCDVEGEGVGGEEVGWVGWEEDGDGDEGFRVCAAPTACSPEEDCERDGDRDGQECLEGVREGGDAGCRPDVVDVDGDEEEAVDDEGWPDSVGDSSCLDVLPADPEEDWEGEESEDVGGVECAGKHLLRVGADWIVMIAQFACFRVRLNGFDVYFRVGIMTDVSIRHVDEGELYYDVVGGIG